MSHFTVVRTKISDIEALRLAVKEMGLELLQSARPRGYYMGELCDYVIRLKGPYDVGLKKNPNGTYDIVTDWWMGYVEREVGPGAGRLLQTYACQKVTLEARRRGYSVLRQQQPDGSIKLVLRGMR